jgi:Ca-activated chloride channel family protein
LSPRIGPDERRFVVFVTDGFVGNEDQILRATATLVDRAADNHGRARVFGVGIGAAPNRALISGLSEVGDAVPIYLSTREPVEPALEVLFRSVDRPILGELEVDWAGLEVSELATAELRELFAGRALTILGRYRGAPSGDPIVRSRASGSAELFEIPIIVAPDRGDARILTSLWARERIADLDRRALAGRLAEPEHDARITELGLEHQLVTAFTSLVAVDSSRQVGDGRPDRVVQPIELPEGVDRDMTVIEVSSTPTMAGSSVSYSSERMILAQDVGDLDPRSVIWIARTASSRGVDERAIRRAVRSRIGEFQACHELY